MRECAGVAHAGRMAGPSAARSCSCVARGCGGGCTPAARACCSSIASRCRAHCTATDSGSTSNGATCTATSVYGGIERERSACWGRVGGCGCGVVPGYVSAAWLPALHMQNAEGCRGTHAQLVAHKEARPSETCRHCLRGARHGHGTIPGRIARRAARVRF